MSLPRLIEPLLALALLLSTSALAEPASFRFSQSQGPHPVGLEVVEQYDYSRAFRSAFDPLGKPFDGERARPMQTLIWYPAEPSRARPMLVEDYGALWASETDFRHPQMPDPAREWFAGAASVLKDRLWAVRDAKAASGRFPVVIYAPSFSSTPWENADLCEYLASNGYVVVASPNLGVTGPDMTQDLAGVETQARDIAFLIGYARTLANADDAHFSIVGFSWGGLANLLAAARDNRIAALVALDGSMRYYPGLVRQARYVHPEQMTIPLLYFEQGNMSLEDVEKYVPESDRTGPNVLNAWTHGDLITVRLLGFTHQEFGSMYQRNEQTWKGYFDPGVPERQQADYDRADGMVGYGWVARYTLAFLDAYIKHDVSALSFLRTAPAQNGVPRHVLWASFRPAVAERN